MTTSPSFELKKAPPPSSADPIKYSDVDIAPPEIVQNFQEYATDPSNLKDLRGQAEVSDIKNNTALRKNLAEFSMLVTVVSLSVWGGVILFQVMGKMSGIEIFSDIQFATITTGCTVNILAVIIGVIKGLFNTENNTHKRKKRK